MSTHEIRPTKLPVLHDSTSALSAATDNDSRLGILVRLLDHRGLNRPMADVYWESITIFSNCEGRICEIGQETDNLVRLKLKEIAKQCRTVAAELVAHARRLEAAAAEEQITKPVDENMLKTLGGRRATVAAVSVGFGISLVAEEEAARLRELYGISRELTHKMPSKKDEEDLSDFLDF